MIPIAIALVVSAPMQLAAAAGVEVSGGYDSTVLNPLSLTFGDGGLLRTAIDLQVGHHTDTLRQTLRARGELYFVGGEGRDIDQSNLTSLNRYTLVWEPTDRWRINVDGGYNVGQGVLLLQNSLDRSATFFRGVYGEYGVHAGATRGLSENARMVLSGGLDGRHSISVPEGTPRADQVQLTAGLTGSYDFGDHDSLGLTGSWQSLQITGIGDWIMRVTAFATWRHSWSEHTATTLSGGVDSIQDQTDVTRSRWNVGPYAGITFQQTIPEANFGIVLRAGYQFTSVNGVRCNSALDAAGTCPRTQVIAGGAGRVGSANVQLLWRPIGDNLVFQGTLAGDYGVTQNFVPGSASGTGSPSTTQEVGNSNFSATAGVRWIITRGISTFVRYTFLFQHVDEPAWYPDIVRHVALAGVTFTVFGGDAEELLGVTPLEESGSAQAIRSAGTGSTSGASDDGGGGDDGSSTITDDGFGANEEPEQTASTGTRTAAQLEDEVAAAQGRPRQPRQPTRPAQAPQPNGRPLQPQQENVVPAQPSSGANGSGANRPATTHSSATPSSTTPSATPPTTPSATTPSAPPSNVPPSTPAASGAGAAQTTPPPAPPSASAQ